MKHFRLRARWMSWRSKSRILIWRIVDCKTKSKENSAKITINSRIMVKSFFRLRICTTISSRVRNQRRSCNSSSSKRTKRIPLKIFSKNLMRFKVKWISTMILGIKSKRKSLNLNKRHLRISPLQITFEPPFCEQEIGLVT